MISIIGNAPSSGSTLLADLLDSTPYTACGPELNLFSNKALYNFNEYKNNCMAASNIASVYNKRSRLNHERLFNYGLDYKGFTELAKNSESLSDFTEVFARRYFALRDKKDDSFLFEKTPENINCIDEFLKYFENNYFVYIVRNPLYVYPSLRKRNFSKYRALSTWLVDCAKYFEFKDHDKVITLKYEDLVKNPYSISADIINKITGREFTENEIKEYYTTNSYRKIFSKKMKSWNVSDYGAIVNANKDKNLTDEILSDLKKSLDLEISGSYAKKFGLGKITFTEALKEFDYYDEFIDKTAKFSKSSIKQNGRDKSRLMQKLLLDIQNGQANINHLFTYLNPVKGY